MSPTDAMFLMVESREHPMHVGSLQLFQPPEDADAMDVRAGQRRRSRRLPSGRRRSAGVD